MKTIGLLGGMSWESTIEYYRLINQGVKLRLGGLHSAKIILNSVDFDPIEKLMTAGDWSGTASILCSAAKSVEAGGADFLLLCTNTMHKLADVIAGSITIPLVHIADAAAEVLRQQGIRKVGLLGTSFTMERPFYRQRLSSLHGLEVIIPETQERKRVHDVIFLELCHGIIADSSKEDYLKISRRLAERGAEGIILGCTEIGMLIKQEDIDITLFDTTSIHAAKAVELALAE
jgi:aspartate racemase